MKIIVIQIGKSSFKNHWIYLDNISNQVLVIFIEIQIKILNNIIKNIFFSFQHMFT